MEDNVQGLSTIFTVKELQEAGSLDACSSQPIDWILGEGTMNMNIDENCHGLAEASLCSGVIFGQGEPCLSLVDMSKSQATTKGQPPKAGRKRKPIGRKAQRKGKKGRRRCRTESSKVDQQLKLDEVPLYLRNVEDYSDPSMRNRIKKAKNSKTFRLNVYKKIDDLTKENERLKTEIEHMRAEKLYTEKMSMICQECRNKNQEFKELAEENIYLKTKMKHAEKTLEGIRSRVCLFFQNTDVALTTSGRRFAA